MTLPRLVLQWPAEWFELYEERAAIMEYLGNLPRRKAEELAEEVIRRQEQQQEELRFQE